ncbi:heme oxygenase-like protein [Patellaria atrata CBS 101060]|uniref:Heme oxygenase-like protein n=1 Tax=Patellaria atrata CBS 101060 TaxID=1346257 RepID=A0A9P4VRH4_9PEZI|nr:heme oxygenase-like protein [Patellaria atrata CBS 101060]
MDSGTAVAVKIQEVPPKTDPDRNAKETSLRREIKARSQASHSFEVRLHVVSDKAGDLTDFPPPDPVLLRALQAYERYKYSKPEFSLRLGPSSTGKQWVASKQPLGHLQTLSSATSRLTLSSANPDIRQAFTEYQDSDTPSKCNKVRCLHCGFTRAKNTTRQIEHLQSCQAYLASPEAQAHLAAQQNGDNEPSIEPPVVEGATRNMLNGTHPNPNLQVHRRGPNSNKRDRNGERMAPPQPIAPARDMAPSLTGHLLNICSSSFTLATQQPFLSHAGCGTLGAGPLCQWLVQDGHYARGYIRFIGQLLAKIRLPAVQNSQFHPMYRTMDVLISAINNIRREMSFFEITATKYGLHLNDEPPNHFTRAYLDLFISSSSSSASLLEGMVVLWATEHCYRSAWLYASSFSHSLSTPSTDSHIVALHQALIPNWTSPAFSKFVDAIRNLVDELANNSSIPNGKEEMNRCEQVFRQVCWIEERFWPDVDGMGEEDESASSRMGVGGIGGGLGTPNQDTNSFGGPLSGISEAAAGNSA